MPNIFLGFVITMEKVSAFPIGLSLTSGVPGDSVHGMYAYSA